MMSIAEGVGLWREVGRPNRVGAPLLRHPPDSMDEMRFHSILEAEAGWLDLDPRWMEWMLESPPRIMFCEVLRWVERYLRSGSCGVTVVRIVGGR